MSVEERSTPDQPKQQSTEAEVQPRRIFGNNASADFLGDLRGKAVIVTQSTGIQYRGILHSVDGFLNVVLRNTKEIYDETVVSELGEVFLRGSAVDYIAAA